MYQFFTMNSATGRLVDGVALAELDTGGISLSALLPQRGVHVLLPNGRRRLLLLCNTTPPETDDGCVRQTDVAKAYPAQVCALGEQPVHHAVLRQPASPAGTATTVLAIPARHPPDISVLRFPERRDPEWVPHIPHPHDLVPAPEGSGEALAIGTTYLLLVLSIEETYRIRLDGGDWVVKARPKNRRPRIWPMEAFIRREERRANEIAKGLQGMM